MLQWLAKNLSRSFRICNYSGKEHPKQAGGDDGVVLAGVALAAWFFYRAVKNKERSVQPPQLREFARKRVAASPKIHLRPEPERRGSILELTPIQDSLEAQTSGTGRSARAVGAN